MRIAANSLILRDLLQLDLAEKDFRTVRKQADPAAARLHLHGLIDDRAVEDKRDPISLAIALQRVPFAGRPFNVAFPMKSGHVFPVVIIAKPPDESLSHCRQRCSGCKKISGLRRPLTASGAIGSVATAILTVVVFLPL